MNTSGTFLTFLIFMPSAKDKETGERKRKLQKVLKIRKSTNIMTSLLLGPKDAVRSTLSFLDRKAEIKFGIVVNFLKLTTIRVVFCRF